MNQARAAAAAWTRAAFIVAAIVVTFGLFWLVFRPWITLWLSSEVLSFVVAEIVDVSALNPNLVKGIVLIALVPFGWSVAEILKFGVWDRVLVLLGKPTTQWVTKRVAATILTAYVAAYFFVLFAASRGQNFRHTAGVAQRWYAVTPEGVRFFDSPGFDPKYGLKLEPVTSTLAVNLARTERGQTPARIVAANIDDIQFFDTLSGQPKVWYFRGATGEIELYSQPGHHPAYGDQLRPVTRDVVGEVRQQLEISERTAAVERTAVAARTERERGEAARAAAARLHNEEVERYTNAITAKAAAVVLTESGRFDQDLSTMLASAIGGTSALFKPTFVSSGLFDAALDGDGAVLRRLDVERRATSVVLGRLATRSTVSTVAGHDIHKGEATLLVRILAADGSSSRSISIKGQGVGFSAGEAKERAEQEAIAQAAAKLKAT